MESGDADLLISDQPRKNRKRFSRKGYNVCLGILNVFCVLVCVTMCTLLVAYTHSVLKDLEETRENLKKELLQVQSDRISGTFNPQEDVADDSDSFSSSEPYHREKRKTKQQPGVSPFVHLVGRPGNMIIEENITYFPWNASQKDPGIHFFELIGDSTKGFIKIRVKTQGVYLVYSQVAIHGRTHVSQPHECSHKTVCHRLKKGTVERTVLLRSMATQYQLGGPFEQNVQDHWLRALDTKVHMGVFLLLKDDELSVQVPPGCGSMKYSLTNMHSYFGLAELSYKWKNKKPKN